MLSILAVLAANSVHPHICGEHYSGSEFNYKYNGSSPHMWGTSTLNLDGKGRARFIPTYVGNIDKAKIPAKIPSVHPHICGEHFSGISKNLDFFGSSPHMWGTYSCATVDVLLKRFIPTYVGNILILSS